MTDKTLTILHAELICRSIEDSGSGVDLIVLDTLANARKQINLNTPSLVITDLNLPDGKGTDLINSDEVNRNYPVILMTSFGDENIAVDAIKSGALDYIVKTPEAFNAMPKSIERVLREWQHITASQQAQLALMHKESEQQEILNSIVDGVITIDETSKILSFNTVAEKLFGYTSDELIGGDLLQLMPDVYRNKHKQGIDRFITSGDAHIIYSSGVELEAQRKDNTCFPIRLSIAELPKCDNNRRRFIGMCQDLSQFKQQEEQLRRSQKMESLGKLTGGIAHDFNNMLGVILGYAELLEIALKGQDKLSKYAHEIHRAGERGAKLTKKLLAFSRQQNSNSELVNINNLLLDVQHMLSKTLTARIKLNYDLYDSVWPVELDKGDLEDALVNMCINSMHAIKENGELTLRTHNELLDINDARLLHLEPGCYVQLSITDTGCGMDSQTVERIFDPFFSTKGEMGTGLGLSQVYSFVERTGGSVNVYSEKGKGTRFVIYFPRSTKSEKNEQDTQIIDIKSLNGTEVILVVDDETSLVELAQDILSNHGYHVLTANDGVQALLVLEKEKVDLVFSDIIMPNFDGYQLYEHVKINHPHVKLLMVSGFTDNRHKQHTDDTIEDLLIQKPYTSNTLLGRVRSLLNEG